MKSKRIVGVAILAIAAISYFGLYSYQSPGIWLQDIKKAAQEGDKDRLRDLIDFDSVKTGLKEDIKTQFVVSMGAELKDNPFAALGLAMASMMVDPMVEMIVSPSGMAALIEKGRVQPPGKGTDIPTPSSSEGQSGYDGMNIERGYDNFSRYRIRIRPSDKQTEEPIILSLKREGLFSWKLTRISLPSNLLSGTAKPQRPRQISIEGSDMQEPDPAKPGLIVLTATLRNQALITVGYPALDVILTDAREHTVARRIFLPAEYIHPGMDARAGIPPYAEATVRLDIDSSGLDAAGFRLALLSSEIKETKELQINSERVRLLKPGALSVQLSDRGTALQAQPSLACLEWGTFAGEDLTRAAGALANLNLGDKVSRTQVDAADGGQSSMFIIRDPGDAMALKIAKLSTDFPSATLKAVSCARPQ